MRISALVFLAGTAASQLQLSMPPNSVSVTGNFKVHQSLSGAQLTLYIEKTMPGFFCHGFGKTMAWGDVFCLEYKGQAQQPTYSDCTLVGKKRPVCTSPSAKWQVVQQDLRPNEARVIVMRNLQQNPVQGFASDGNDYIYAYSDSLTIEGHKGRNASFGSVKLPFLGVVEAQNGFVQTPVIITTGAPVIAVPAGQGDTVVTSVPNTSQDLINQARRFENTQTQVVVPVSRQNGTTFTSTPQPVLFNQPLTTTTTFTSLPIQGTVPVLQATSPQMVTQLPFPVATENDRIGSILGPGAIYVRCKFHNGICYPISNNSSIFPNSLRLLPTLFSTVLILLSCF